MSGAHQLDLAWTLGNPRTLDQASRQFSVDASDRHLALVKAGYQSKSMHRRFNTITFGPNEQARSGHSRGHPRTGTTSVVIYRGSIARGVPGVCSRDTEN